jgi:hypothetical protein
MSKYDLVVAYRIYPGVSKVPPVFSDNKYRLSQFCLKSFKKSLGELKVKMIVLLDNCPPEYDEIFKKLFKEEDLELVKLDGIGNLGTFALQIKYLLEQNFSDVVYFAEDDYFYMPNQFIEMVTLLKENEDVDFVSPYDHPEDYSSKLHDHPNFLKSTDTRHWRTASSTCLTFLTDKKTLNEVKNVLNSYSSGNHDASMWFSLTKYNLFNPIKIVKNLRNRVFISLLFNSWRYSLKQVIYGKKRKLWVPIPTIGIHMESDYLPPTKAYLDFMETEAKILEKDLNNY